MLAGQRYLREQQMRFRVSGEHHAVVVEDHADVPVGRPGVVEAVAARDKTTEVARSRGIWPEPLSVGSGGGFNGCLQHVEVMTGGAADNWIAL